MLCITSPATSIHVHIKCMVRHTYMHIQLYRYPQANKTHLWNIVCNSFSKKRGISVLCICMILPVWNYALCKLFRCCRYKNLGSLMSLYGLWPRFVPYLLTFMSVYVFNMRLFFSFLPRVLWDLYDTFLLQPNCWLKCLASFFPPQRKTSQQ